MFRIWSDPDPQHCFWQQGCVGQSFAVSPIYSFLIDVCIQAQRAARQSFITAVQMTDPLLTQVQHPGTSIHWWWSYWAGTDSSQLITAVHILLTPPDTGPAPWDEYIHWWWSYSAGTDSLSSQLFILLTPPDTGPAPWDEYPLVVVLLSRDGQSLITAVHITDPSWHRSSTPGRVSTGGGPTEQGWRVSHHSCSYYWPLLTQVQHPGTSIHWWWSYSAGTDSLSSQLFISGTQPVLSLVRWNENIW
jgi:hypothetical protein